MRLTEGLWSSSELTKPETKGSPAGTNVNGSGELNRAADRTARTWSCSRRCVFFYIWNNVHFTHDASGNLEYFDSCHQNMVRLGEYCMSSCVWLLKITKYSWSNDSYQNKPRQKIKPLMQTGSFSIWIFFFFLVLLISPGNGNRSLAQGAIWASEESLSTWFDRWNQWELRVLQGPGWGS